MVISKHAKFSKRAILSAFSVVSKDTTVSGQKHGKGKSI
jgi:hypothetical protein